MYVIFEVNQGNYQWLIKTAYAQHTHQLLKQS